MVDTYIVYVYMVHGGICIRIWCMVAYHKHTVYMVHGDIHVYMVHGGICIYGAW